MEFANVFHRQRFMLYGSWPKWIRVSGRLPDYNPKVKRATYTVAILQIVRGGKVLRLQNSTVIRWKTFVVGPSRATNLQILIERKVLPRDGVEITNQQQYYSSSVLHDLACDLMCPSA